MGETAKDTIGWWKKLWQGDPTATALVPKGRQMYGNWGQSQSPQTVSSEKAPAGLEKYWSKLPPERKQKVRSLLAKGIPMNRIVEALEK